MNEEIKILEAQIKILESQEYVNVWTMTADGPRMKSYIDFSTMIDQRNGLRMKLKEIEKFYAPALKREKLISKIKEAKGF
jgi:hypothetical protein